MNSISSNDLQELVNANIISEEKALEIETYLARQKAGSPSKLNIIFGMLGALLVSLGIILFIAHNWDELSVSAKTVCAFLPLIIGQALCIYSIFYKKDNELWREASAIVLFFAVAASISLISQVYHVDGTLESFLFTWILLTAPLVYLLRSTVAAFLVIAVASWYTTEAGYSRTHNNIPWLYLVVLAFLIPHYLNFFKHTKAGNTFYWYNWIIAASTLVCLGCFTGYDFNGVIFIYAGYLALVTLFYQTGKRLSPGKSNFFSNPFLKLGVIGIIIIFMMLSFEEFWPAYHNNTTLFASPFIYITIAMFGVCVFNFVQRNLEEKWQHFDPVESALYVFTVAAFTNTQIGVFIINAWLLVIALWYIRRGSAENNFGLLNLGLLVIASLAIARFFDDQIPFIWRGFFFLAAGIGFFAANYRLLQKRKEIAQKNKA